MSDETKHPATITVHWPTGPVDCCKEHADKLVALGNMLGSYIVQTGAEEGSICSNCENEESNGKNREEDRARLGSNGGA